MKNIFSNPLFHLAIVLFLVLGIEGYYSVAALSSPLSQPPFNTGNTGYPPLDTGSTTQTKIGSLFIGDTSNNIGLLNSGTLGFTTNNTLQSYITYDGGSGNLILYNYNKATNSYVTSTPNSKWNYSDDGVINTTSSIIIGTTTNIKGNSSTVKLMIGQSSSSSFIVAGQGYNVGIGNNVSNNAFMYINPNGGLPRMHWLLGDYRDMEIHGDDGAVVIGGDITAGNIIQLGTNSYPDRVVGGQLVLAKSPTSAWGDVKIVDKSNSYYDTQGNGINETDCPDGFFMTGIRLSEDYGPVLECHRMFPLPPQWFKDHHLY